MRKWRRATLPLPIVVLLVMALANGHDRPIPTAGGTVHAQETGVDPTRLPVGDGRRATEPAAGAVWSCASTFGGGGAQASGAWLRDDGTFDLTVKPVVQGAVDWPHELTVELLDGRRRIRGNDLPAHPTGHFPIAPTDPAFAFDRNPNAIRAQRLDLDLPAVPSHAGRPSCLPLGPIGVLLSGAYVFNALDARGKDALAHEIQDACQGHPERSGAYHYHTLSPCLADEPTVHSPLFGYALDGFGLFGHHGEDGADLTNADLDPCHGHTHTVLWDGEPIAIYHYHATHEYPYTMGCFQGR